MPPRKGEKLPYFAMPCAENGKTYAKKCAMRRAGNNRRMADKKIFAAPVHFLDKGRGVCYTLAQLNKNYCHRVVGYGHSYAHR